MTLHQSAKAPGWQQNDTGACDVETDSDCWKEFSVSGSSEHFVRLRFRKDRFMFQSETWLLAKIETKLPDIRHTLATWIGHALHRGA